MQGSLLAPDLILYICTIQRLVNPMVQGKIVAQGKLLLRGPLLCAEDPGPNSRFKEMTVFLFEQIIIFSETVGKKTQFTSPVYIYRAHIQVQFMYSLLVQCTYIELIYRYNLCTVYQFSAYTGLIYRLQLKMNSYCKLYIYIDKACTYVSKCKNSARCKMYCICLLK